MADIKTASAFGMKPSVVSAVGLVLTFIAVFLFIYQPYGYYRKWKLRFNDNDNGFNSWKLPASDILMKIYIFNITNKDAFLEGREKLKVQEVGPYIWRQYMERQNPIFNPENDTVTINPSIKFEWVSWMNVGKRDDFLMLPNVAYLLFRSEVEQYTYLKKLAVKAIVGPNVSLPIVPQTVEEYLFGFEDEITKIGRKWMPDRIPYEKLGLVDRTYDLRGDVVNVHAGELNAGTFAAYNYHSELPHWKAPCNKIDGASDGVKFPAELQPNQSLSFYLKSMCRPIPMVQVGGESNIHGLRSVRYKFHEDALDSGDKIAENKCFCRNERCLPDGLIDITDCSNEFTVALSYPHFYRGDPVLFEKVDGLKPVEEHESYFVINSDTGTLISTSVKIQTNAVLGDLSELADCKAFSNMTVPLMWMDVFVADMSPYSIFIFILFLRVMPWLDRIGRYILLFLGIGLIIYGGHCFRRLTINRRKSSDSIQDKKQYFSVATEEGRNISATDKKSKLLDKSLMDHEK